MSGLYQQALGVLQINDADEKMQATRRLARNWGEQRLCGNTPTDMPDMPARPNKPELVPPGDVPRRRPGSPEGRAALLHAVAHIEFNAINLALDMICRFGSDNRIPAERREEFADDWMKVADDEARHFGLICERLKSLGYHYGDFPAHNGLWEAALSTRHDLAARLAIAPMVLEARGLDVTPGMIKKFERINDAESARILHIIYNDEVYHVQTGTKWFHEIARIMEKPAEDYFKTLVKTHFKGQLKPPFNHLARNQAGFPATYYDWN